MVTSLAAVGRKKYVAAMQHAPMQILMQNCAESSAVLCLRQKDGPTTLPGDEVGAKVGEVGGQLTAERKKQS